MGAAAVLLWSSTATCTSWGGKALGPWQFIFISSTIGGLAQVLFHGLYRRQWRPCFVLPGRLWLLVLLTFVLYGLLYPWAIIACHDEPQRLGVNLINYLWPALTVVLSIVFIPQSRFSWPVGAAIVLALSGELLANKDARLGQPLPYLAVLLAAILWAVYSVALARWRQWSHAFATAPVGFLLIGAIAGVTSYFAGDWVSLTPSSILAAAMAGLGPMGSGYLLWENALHRAPAGKLGFLAAATPVLSTLLLCLAGGRMPDGSLIVAAVLIGGAVLIGVWPSRRPRPDLCEPPSPTKP